MRNRALHGTCPHGGHDTAQAIYEASQAEATAKEGIKAAAKNRARADFAAPWIAYGWE